MEGKTGKGSTKVEAWDDIDDMALIFLLGEIA